MNNAPLDLLKMESVKLLLDAIEIGIAVVAADGSLEFANQTARQLLGCPDDRDLAAFWNTLLKDRAAALDGNQGHAPASLEVEVPRPDRPLRLRLECYPLDEERHFRAFVLRDCAAADHVDLRLINRYRSLARLYRTIGHDLKAPLNALTINLDLLKTSMARYTPPDPMIRERQQRYLKVLEDELARLNRSLVTFLLQAVPPTREAAGPFNLREVLVELVSLVAPQARQQQVAVEVEMVEQDLVLEGQRDLLKQALLNIMVNALEAMGKGGRLALKLENRMGRAVIQIQDTGPGIPAAVIEQIWELNYTTKKTGSGIGLYVARSIIESFGGTVAVQSRDGQGTTFAVSLPIALKEGI